MEQSVLDAQRAYWNNIFAQEAAPVPAGSHWIGELLNCSSERLQGDVLEIGCGRGYDTRYLLDAGCGVTCLDLSWNALQVVRRAAGSARLVNAALPAPLPFAPATFDHVVAGLSLHYFRWRDTRLIIGEIGRVLRPDGLLIFQVNSSEDIAHGAGRGAEIEPHLFLHQGRYKRFFTERMCQDLFGADWRLERLIPRVEKTLSYR